MKFKGLAFAIGALVALAAIVLGANRWIGTQAPAGRLGKPLLGNVDLSAAAKIIIRSHQGRVTMNSSPDGAWTVSEQGSFPAASNKLKELLVKLSEQKVAHKVTDKKEKLPALGLLAGEENGGKWEQDKTGVQLRFLDSENKELYALLIGRDRGAAGGSGFGGTYVRFGGESTAYLVGESVLFDYRPEDWIDKKIFDEDGDKTVKALHIRQAGKPAVTLTRDKPETPWAMKGVAAGKLDQDEIKSLVNLIAGLEIYKIGEGGRPPKTMGRDRTGRVEFEFFDQRKFFIDIGRNKAADDYRYLTIRADLDPAVTDEKLRGQVVTFNQRFQNRLLGIYDWDGKQLLQGQKDFLAKPDPPAPGGKK